MPICVRVLVRKDDTTASADSSTSVSYFSNTFPMESASRSRKEVSISLRTSVTSSLQNENCPNPCASYKGSATSNMLCPSSSEEGRHNCVRRLLNFCFLFLVHFSNGECVKEKEVSISLRTSVTSSLQNENCPNPCASHKGSATRNVLVLHLVSAAA
jgi:hypothetical protein